MPERRAESLATLRGAMSRSKQLGGFPTSGVFGFKQTHTHAPPSPSGSTNFRHAPGSIGVISRGIGGDEHFTPYPAKVVSSVPPTTKRRSDEQSAVSKPQLREQPPLHRRVIEQPILTLLIVVDASSTAK